MKNSIKRIILSIVIVATLVCCVLGFAACNKKDPSKFSSTTTFRFDGATSVMGVNWTIINEFEAFNIDECYVRFTSDGKIHGQLRTSADALELLNMSLGDLGDQAETNASLTDLSQGEETNNKVIDMIGDMDLKDAVATYLEPMFRGFTLDNIEGSLGLLKAGVGFSLKGLDFENEKIAALADYIKVNGKTPKNMSDYIPDDLVLGIDFDSTYTIKTVTGDDGTKYDAIYIGELASRNNTQPFAVMTLGRNLSGKRTIAMRVEFIKLQLSATEE